jgi:hypothetical protein
MFDKIFGVVEKINSGLNKASRMQRTLDGVMYQQENLSQVKSKGKLYWTILIVILIVAVLYVIFG